MTLPSFIITLSPIMAFDMTQFEPIFTLSPIRTFFFNVVFNPTLKFFPIFTEVSTKVLFTNNFLYLTLGLNLKLSPSASG